MATMSMGSTGAGGAGGVARVEQQGQGVTAVIICLQRCSIKHTANLHCPRLMQPNFLLSKVKLCGLRLSRVDLLSKS